MLLEGLEVESAATNVLLIAKDAELTARTAELAAAKHGLGVTQLTIEKLKGPDCQAPSE